MGGKDPSRVFHALSVSLWANLWGLSTIPQFTDEEVEVEGDEQLATFTQLVK